MGWVAVAARTGSGQRGEQGRGGCGRWERCCVSGAETLEREWQRTGPRRGRSFYNVDGKGSPPTSIRSSPANGDPASSGKGGRGLGRGHFGVFLLPAPRLSRLSMVPLLLGWAGTFGGFPDDGLSSAHPGVLKKAGSHVGGGTHPRLDQRGPGHLAKEAWEEARNWEGRLATRLRSGSGWVRRRTGKGVGRGGVRDPADWKAW